MTDSSSSDSGLPINEVPTYDEVGHDSSDTSELSISSNLFIKPGRRRVAIDDVPEKIGDYQIKGYIGSGGMGDVFLAEHLRMERMVAIKMLPMDRMNQASSVERFYAEVRAASRLLHPNIVTAFDAGEVDSEELGGVHYLAMEYVDGITLTQVISSSGPMPVGQAAGVIRQAALGLLHAHRAGIVHRDIKPGNLMRAKDGTIKVLDLGLARVGAMDYASMAGPETPGDASTDSAPAVDERGNKSHGRLVGTLPFMSPEQLEDPDSADARSDIYSLGATLHFLLTARPPYTGEYLDQVYGHRHGEIPDLMQIRDDVDLNFANIFCRMLAKSPEQRYASLDEVIDDLAPYSSDSDIPVWLIEFSERRASSETSTYSGHSGGSTTGGPVRVFGIDLGMHYSAAAAASPAGESVQLTAGQNGQQLFRMAIAYDQHLLFDQAAIKQRNTGARSIAHCLQLYIGQSAVARHIAGQYCPPEVLLALAMREIYTQSWDTNGPPHATAITIPASYDQLHRRSIYLAAQLAGFSSVRLLDRSIAAVHSLWDQPEDASNVLPGDLPGADELVTGDSAIMGSGAEEFDSHAVQLDSHLGDWHGDQQLLFIGLTGQATEVAVIRRTSGRLDQQATTGHWHGGTLPWLHRLVDLAAGAFKKQHSVDAKSSSVSATHLQIACEQALHSLLIMPQVKVTIQIDAKPLSVTLDRADWLTRCEGLIQSTNKLVTKCLAEAMVKPDQIDHCIVMGPILKLPRVRDRVVPRIIDRDAIVPVDRSDVARGAAACLASELPGRGNVAMPPRSVTSQTIGIVVEDAKRRRRILPLIRKGTSLPARTNKRLSVSPNRSTMKISLVESSGVEGQDWHSLGRYEIDVSEATDRKQARDISFEIDINGLLSVRAPLPLSKGDSSTTVRGSTKLPPLPASNLTEEEIAAWSRWIESVSRPIE